MVANLLKRFSLYGFLKNQRYFEPFLVLIFLEKGLTFFLIGLLIAWREVMINILEVPSGMVADLYGRRRSMMLSFVAYVSSFVLFGLSQGLPGLFLAMTLFSLGEAFRTGTHKALIFAWLRARGMENERTRVYGYTRSWSKFGSALSVLLAAAFVFLGQGYSVVFYLSIPPYLLGLVNFMGYPAWLDGAVEAPPPSARLLRRIWGVTLRVFRMKTLRRLVLESMGFEGVFKAVKDYLQPLLQATALGLFAGHAMGTELGQEQKTAVLMAPVFFVLHVLSGLAARRAHDLASARGGEVPASRVVWGLTALLYAVMLPALAAGWYLPAIVGFVALHVLQNLWRPMLISRFDANSPESWGATVLSIESQAKSLATMALAPLLGLAVDLAAGYGAGGGFWPVALLGFLVSLVFFLTAPRKGPCRESV